MSKETKRAIEFVEGLISENNKELLKKTTDARKKDIELDNEDCLACISALKANEKVIAYCKQAIEVSGESDYGAGTADTCDNILEILEEGTK
jgi:hypothetical protein